MKLQPFIIGAIIGAVIVFYFKDSQKEILEVPVEVQVEVPVIERVFDTVIKPVPVPYKVTKVDTSLIGDYKKANDSLREQLYKSAITVQEYKETFEDSVQTITVSAQAALLKSLAITYKTKPRKIAVDTSLQVEIPSIRFTLSPYMEIGVPTVIEQPLVLKAGLDIKTKKSIYYGFSYDTNKTVWLKVGKAFNF